MNKNTYKLFKRCDIYLGLYETLIDVVIARKTAEKNMGHKY